MEEDKEPMFDTVDTVKSCLEVLYEMLKVIEFKHENMKKALNEGFITATDVADYLSRKGMPFRNSHEVAGKIVSYAEKKGLELPDLNISEFKKFSDLFEGDLYKYITLDGSINSRKSHGGTAKSNVRKMIKSAKKEIASW